MVDNVVFCGSRSINDYDEVKSIIDDFAKWYGKPFVIVHGGAKLGVDAMAAKYADQKGIKFKVIEADWDKDGKSAGFKRNAELREIADYTVALWDGESHGTADMIKNTNTAVLSVIILEPNPKMNKFFYDYRKKK